MPLIPSAASSVVERLREKAYTLATAESLTAGLIASAIAAVPGASDVLWGGFIAYRNEAKERVLGVDRALLIAKGSVSKETAEAMAVGALAVSGCAVAVSATGIAGPSGGTEEVPVGTVWISVAVRKSETSEVFRKSEMLSLKGNRNDIRSETVKQALRLVGDCLDTH